MSYDFVLIVGWLPGGFGIAGVCLGDCLVVGVIVCSRLIAGFDDALCFGCFVDWLRALI